MYFPLNLSHLNLFVFVVSYISQEAVWQHNLIFTTEDKMFVLLNAIAAALEF